MTVRFSRRDTLLRTAAVAAAGLIPGAAIPGLAAPLARADPHSGEIDAVLQARVDCGRSAWRRRDGRDGAFRDLSGRIRRAEPGRGCAGCRPIRSSVSRQ